jgi:hypothetical protein
MPAVTEHLTATITYVESKVVIGVGEKSSLTAVAQTLTAKITIESTKRSRSYKTTSTNNYLKRSYGTHESATKNKRHACSHV